MSSPENKPQGEAARNPQPELLAVLQKAKNGLAFLTPNDWFLLTDKARSVTLKKEEALIQFGQHARQVYFLIEGVARVEAQSGSKIGRIRPGEICGEMAFLERSNASASVIADQEVRAYAVDWQVMDELFQLYPHLGSRFYRSVAVNLSRRLRDFIKESGK